MRPTLLDFDLEGDEVVDIASGKCHTILLTNSNKLYFWGNNQYNQSNQHLPYYLEQIGLIQLNIPFKTESKIAKIKANFDRSAVLTQDG